MQIGTISPPATAMMQSVRAFAPQAEGWVLEPSRDRPKSLKLGLTAKRSAIGVSVTGSRR